MNDGGLQFEAFLFGIVPYVALILFFLGTIQRYRQQSFTYSSLSSQFLENEQHFWAVVPFHYGIIVVLTGHVIGFLVPSQVLLWNCLPLRLAILEFTALIFGIMSLVGLVAVLLRRSGNARLRQVTSRADWVIFLLLLVQVVSGVAIAVFVPWGSSWFAAAAAPYLWSIVHLNPVTGFIVGLPWLVKLHLLNAWLVIGLFPYTRLVHILVIPNMYLWRRWQVVRWWRPVPLSARSSRPAGGAS